MRGAVYQFPARRGKPIYVVGYRVGSEIRRSGWSDECGQESAVLAMHMRDMIEGARGGTDGYGRDDSDLIDACLWADSIAKHAAEKERAYQAAWSLGSQFADHRRNVRDVTAAAKSLRAELRQARAVASAAGAKLPAVCRALKARLASYRADIADARKSMAKILRDSYFDKDTRPAFCDGAELSDREAKRLGV